MNILYIDTSSDIAQIGLVSENKTTFNKFKSRNRLSDILLTKIQKLLLKNKIDIKNLNALAVFRGPGSFTGLRIGIATANALAFALEVSIIEITKSDEKNLPRKIRKKFETKSFKKIAVPFYGKPPSITKPKK